MEGRRSDGLRWEYYWTWVVQVFPGEFKDFQKEHALDPNIDWSEGMKNGASLAFETTVDATRL